MIQTHDDYVAESQLIEKFKQCERIVHKTCEHDKDYKHNAMVIEGEEFSYLTSKELHHAEIDATDEEVKSTLKVLRAYRKTAEAQINNLKKKI